MNSTLKLIVIFLLLINCKKEISSKKELENVIEEGNKVDKDTNVQIADSSKTFYTSYYKARINKTEKITTIVNSLQTSFTRCQLDKDLNELKQIKEFSKSKGFLKNLSRDFKNNDFLEVSSIYYSYIESRKEEYPSRITVEEWYFKDEQKAKSCFESLKKYEEFTIYFKSINWIWVYQNHKIFLVFALDHLVTGKEMQEIKNEIINVIKPSGAYESVQFYE